MEEYIAVRINSGSVSEIGPMNPQTQSARLQDGSYGSVADALNKMAEYGFRLVPGMVIPWSPDTCTVIMRREK